MNTKFLPKACCNLEVLQKASKLSEVLLTHETIVQILADAKTCFGVVQGQS